MPHKYCHFGIIYVISLCHLKTVFISKAELHLKVVSKLNPKNNNSIKSVLSGFREL